MIQDAGFISTAEAARIRGVGVRTIHRWAASGQLEPAAKIPGRTGAFLFRREDVEALAAAEAAEPVGRAS